MSTTQQIPRPDRTHELGAVRPDVRAQYRPAGRPDAPPVRTLTVGKVSGVLLLAAVLGGLTGGVYALVTATPPPVGTVVGGKTPGPPPATSAPPQTTETVVTAKPSGNVRTVQASPVRPAAVVPSGGNLRPSVSPSAGPSGSPVVDTSPVAESPGSGSPAADETPPAPPAQGSIACSDGSTATSLAACPTPTSTSRSKAAPST